MEHENGIAIDTEALASLIPSHECARWRVKWRVDKYHRDQVDGVQDDPFEVIEGEGNLLTTAGVNAMLTALTGGAITAFSNANAYIGVGDGNGSVPTPAVGDTDLTAPTNKLRKGQQATFPSISTNVATFKSSFLTAEANWVWNEWGIFNASAAGTMLNHRGVNLGTKATGQWDLTVTITIS